MSTPMIHGANGRRTARTVRPADNPFQAAVDAVGLGTWDWDLRSGRIVWTPRTWQLFGLEPGGAHEIPYERFLQSVHAADRPEVARRVERAVRERGRTVFAYRVVLADGRVRFLRAPGRVVTDERGRAVRMLGLVEDVTEERQADAPPGLPQWLSARAVAHLLGVAEATVKRLAVLGQLGWLRSSRKNSRRFSPDQVIDYLRQHAEAGGLEAAARGRDVAGALLAVMEQLRDGARFADLLETAVRPVVERAEKEFAAELIKRLPYLESGSGRTAAPAMLAAQGSGRRWDAALAGCLLRAGGREVLTPADGAALRGLVDLAERLRPGLVLILTADDHAEGLHVASVISSMPRPPLVCLWSNGPLPSAPGVATVRSLAELAPLVRTA